MDIFELGRDKKNSLLDMINEKLIESNKFKYYFYTITGKILPLILILTAIFVSVSAMLGLMAVTFVNIYINSKERDRIKANGLMYLRRVIKASKQIVKINDKNLESFNIKIRENLKDLKSIDRNTIMISFINMWGGVFEFISVLFLLEETAYYKIADSIEKIKIQF